MRRSGAGCASGLFSAGKRGKLPRPAPRLRAGPACEVSFAGRSAVPRRGRCGPALLRKALRCSCRAVACGGPGVSFDSGRRPLVRRRRLRDRGVSQPPTPGMPPRPPRPPRSPRQRRLRSRTPALSRRAPRAFRRSREAAALPRSMPGPPVLTSRLSGASDSPPPRQFKRVAYPCLCAGASPRPLQDALASRMTAPRRRHPAGSPRQRRISAGRPVSRSVGAPADYSRARRLRRRARE